MWKIRLYLEQLHDLVAKSKCEFAFCIYRLRNTCGTCNSSQAMLRTMMNESEKKLTFQIHRAIFYHNNVRLHFTDTQGNAPWPGMARQI
jgi:hypothetical protein